jgi:hypothetical protein
MASANKKRVMEKWEKILSVFVILSLFFLIYIFIFQPEIYNRTDSSNITIYMGYVISALIFIFGLLTLIIQFVSRFVHNIYLKKDIKYKKQPAGLAGWLLVIVMLTVFNLIIQISSIIFAQIVNFSLYDLIYSLITILLSITFLVLIFSKRKNAINKIIFVLWTEVVIGIINSILSFDTIVTLTETPIPLVYSSIIFSVLFDIGITIALTLYFKKSQRVKNTFILK